MHGPLGVFMAFGRIKVRGLLVKQVQTGSSPVDRPKCEREAPKSGTSR